MITKWSDILATASLTLVLSAPMLTAFWSVGRWVYAIPIAVMVLAAAMNLLLERVKAPRGLLTAYLTASIALILWLMLSSSWNYRSFAHLDNEVILLTTLLTVTVATPFIMGNRRSFDLFIVFLSVIGILLAAFVLQSYYRIGDFRGYEVAIHEAYLVLAHLLGLATVGLTVYLIGTWKRRWWWWIVPLVLMTALGMALARGALISAVVIVFGAAIYVLTVEGLDRTTLARYTTSLFSRIGTISLLLGIILWTGVVATGIDRTAQRFARLLTGREFQGGRWRVWEEAWERITEGPTFGYGLGAHESILEWADYPHNLVLQVWLDGGAIAVALLLLVLVVPFLAVLLRGRSRHSDKLWLPYLGMFAFAILEYSKSMDFYSARSLFVTGALAVCALGISSGPQKVHEEAVPASGPREPAK